MKEHEATCWAGCRCLCDLFNQKNQLLAMRAARHLMQLPSSERCAREAASSAERGRQERMRHREENHEAQAAFAWRHGPLWNASPFRSSTCAEWNPHAYWLSASSENHRPGGESPARPPPRM